MNEKEKPIEYEHAQCSLYTIQKVSQILEQMEKCGFAIQHGKLEQVNLFYKSEMTYKFMS